MPDLPRQPPCGACFEAGAPVIEEVFSNDIIAFGQYARLLTEGRSPALCQKDCGAFHVCHRAPKAVPRPEKDSP